MRLGPQDLLLHSSTALLLASIDRPSRRICTRHSPLDCHLRRRQTEADIKAREGRLAAALEEAQRLRK